MSLMTARQESFAAGMNDTAAPEEYRPDEVSVLYDGRLELAGNACQRRDGSKRTHPSALNGGATVYGLQAFTAGDGTDYLVAMVGTKAYASSDGGATWSEIATGLTADYWDFVVSDACGTPTLYGVNGASPIYEWDGTTWSTITASSGSVPDGARFIEVFGGRLYAAGHDGETVVASMVEDFTKWGISDGALSVKVSTNEGDTEIRGIYQLGEALIVWKRRSMGYIAGFGWETLQVEAGPEGGVSRSVGCVAHRTIQATAEDAVVWLSERGWEFYQLGGQPQLIGRPLQGFTETLHRDHIEANDGVPVATYWPRKNEYWCAVPTGSATQNDRIFVWRPPAGATTGARWIFRPGFDVATLALADRSGDGAMPYAGGYGGFVRELETGDKDDVLSDDTGGSSITHEVQTRPFTYGSQQIQKRGRIVRAAVEASAESDVNLAIVADGVAGTARTVTYASNSGPVSQKTRLNERGYVLAVKLTTTTDAKIAGLELEAEPNRRGW